MTSIHAQSSAYTMEYSNHVTGALDLSRSRRPEPYYREELSLHNYDREMESHSSSNHPNSPKARRLSPSLNESDSTKHYKIEDRLHNTSEQSVDESYLNNFYRREARSPSLYGNDNKETSHSPSQISGQVSPNYASCFPGTEHMNPYIIQAALRQQMILQNKKSSTKGDSDDISDSDGSQNSNIPIYPIATPGRDGKMPRPFKAYPKDPMSLAAGFSTVDSLLDTQSAEKYSAFRKRMLDQICAANGGQATVSNPKMRRTVNTNSNAVCYTSDDGSLKYDHPSKDTSYTERRKKNNAAAKKSRDRRRIKEDEIAIRAAFLERENIELKFELAAAKKQLALCGITMGNNPGH